MYTMEPLEDNISDAVEFIGDYLKKKGVPEMNKVRAMMIAEDTLIQMVDKAEPGSKIEIEAHGRFGKLELRLCGRGEPFDLADIQMNILNMGGESESEKARESTQKIIEKVFWDWLSVRNDRGVNLASISVQKSRYDRLIHTLIALFLGVVVGLIFHYLVPDAAGDFVHKYVFDPVQYIFINAMKLLVAPLTFFAVSASIANFGNSRAAGRISMKIFSIYMFTALVAIGIGYIVYLLAPSVDRSITSAASELAQTAYVEEEANAVSLWDTIINVVPKDILSPFLKGDTLQLVFLAVVLGLAGSTMYFRVPAVKNALDVGDRVMSHVVLFFSRFIPIVVFVSMATMTMYMGPEDFWKVVIWIPENLMGFLILIALYLLLLIFPGRLNPLIFVKKVAPAALTAIATNSTSATIPTSIKTAKRLGVTEKFSSLAIPIEVAVNLDGSCVMMMITTLFLAGVYGVPISGTMLLSLIVSAFALSIGCPGVMGAEMIYITILLQLVGVPAGGIGLVIGLYPICDMMLNATNVVGDLATTVILARRELEFDSEQYKA